MASNMYSYPMQQQMPYNPYNNQMPYYPQQPQQGQYGQPMPYYPQGQYGQVPYYPQGQYSQVPYYPQGQYEQPPAYTPVSSENDKKDKEMNLNDKKFSAKEIREAIESANKAIEKLHKAERHLKSAKKWGYIDMVAGDFGGFISTMAKQSKMADAQRDMRAAKIAIEEFNKELVDVKDFKVPCDDLLILADFMFDCVVTDFIVQTKIKKAKENCKTAISKIETIKQDLENRLKQVENL